MMTVLAMSPYTANDAKGLPEIWQDKLLKSILDVIRNSITYVSPTTSRMASEGRHADKLRKERS
jgi:hypothetical protein